MGRLSAAEIKGWHAEGYYPGNAVVAAAGNVDHDGLLEELNERLARVASSIGGDLERVHDAIRL